MDIAGDISLVVEEKPICREALGRILLECRGVGELRFAGSLGEAIREVSHARPGVALVDLFTVNYDFRRLKQFVEQARSCKVIAIDDRANPAFASLASWAGAAGYLAKDLELDQFKTAIAAALRGEGGLLQSPVEEEPVADDDPSPPGNGALSARQRDVLGQLALGKSNQEIAEALGISVGTVKVHVHAVLKLIGARNRTRAALIAARFLAIPKAT